MDPRDFHRLAVHLSTGAASAEYRSSISRSYYALFNVGAEHLRTIGFSIGRGAAAHGEVHHCLANSGDASLLAVAAELSILHSKRNRADYQLDKRDVESSSAACDAAGIAGSMIQTLDAAFRGPSRAQIQSAITKWRRENGYP
jgi:hypothetical protein